MYRRDFLKTTGAGLAGFGMAGGALGSLLLPGMGHAVPAEVLNTKIDVALKKKLATAALETATKAGATYCDVRIGRYLRQFVITREDKVQNVVNTESTGAGIRVIVGGAWGFAASRPSRSRARIRRSKPRRWSSRRTRALAMCPGSPRSRNRR
jgi:TldD protein